MRSGALFIAAVSLTASGCTSGNWNSVYRTFDLSEGESVAIDAKQRVVLVKREVLEGQPYVYVCAEPSPDALSVYGSEIAADATTPQDIKVKLAGALSETGSNIGLRTQTIQLLRDAMYRLCEGYMSGALSQIDFKRLQRRYQNAMLGLLAVEQLTGTVVPRQVILTASGSTDSKDSDDGDTNGTPQETDQQAQPETPAKETPGSSSGNAPIVAQAPPPSDAAIAQIADTVEAIVTEVLRSDLTEEECLAVLLDDKRDSGPNRADVSIGVNFCRAYLEERTFQLRNEASRLPNP